MKRPPPSQRLRTRLAAMGVPIDPKAAVVRTHAGEGQRQQGAWSWFLDPDPRIPDVSAGLGSYLPVTTLVRSQRLMVYLDHHTKALVVDVWHVPSPYQCLFEEPERRHTTPEGYAE